MGQDKKAEKKGNGEYNTKREDEQDARHSCGGICSWLPCFRPYRGDMEDIRTVISNAPFSGDPEIVYGHEFMSNYVSTTRYTVWNFLFKNLYEQFQKAANFYFLLVAIVTSIPGVSTIPVWSTVTPLAFVLGVTAIKDGIDDYKRYKNDREQNRRQVEVLISGESGETRRTRWEDLQVGHVIKVNEGGVFPADLVLLTSSRPNGDCGIQTATLDGETNLKLRQALKETAKLSPDVLAREGEIVVKCERPHTALYQFDGQLLLGEERHSLNSNHLLPRGAIMKETKYVYALVVYTGDQTKIMLNNDPPRFKRSHMDLVMNKQMYLIFVLQFCIVFTATVLSGWFYVNQAGDHWYLRIDDTSTNAGARIGLRNFFAFYVLLSVMVPISLYVSMELVRVGQAIFVNIDNSMWDEEDGKLASVKSTTLSEELGQIQYIFSDKTGTLTSNQMAFEKCSIAGKLYGDNHEGRGEGQGRASSSSSGVDVKKIEGRRMQVDGKKQRPNDEQQGLINDPRGGQQQQQQRSPQQPQKLKQNTTTTAAAAAATPATPITTETAAATPSRNLLDSVEIDGDPRFCNMRDQNLISALVAGDKRARDYVLALALCHTCSASPDPERPGKVVYSGESTDEIALVSMASFHGVRFVERNRDKVTLALPWPASEDNNNNNNNSNNNTPTTDSKGGGGASTTSSSDGRSSGLLAGKLGRGSSSASASSSSSSGRRRFLRQYKILHVIAFSSDRKRMSVVVRFPDGTIRVLTKGADNVLKALASTDESVNSKTMWKHTDQQLHHFSREGLRVMLVGQRTLSMDEYKKWSLRYKAASESFADASGNRSDKMAHIAREVENDLKILGVTAIEDKLQVGVPSTLQQLKKAGIKIWVLTGDKQNTAVNIGKSCGLIGWGYTLCYIRETEKQACLHQMSALLDTLGNDGPSAALMVSGDSLKTAMMDDENRNCLFELMNHPRVRVVVASRMSPRQKAEVVTLVKEKLGVVTLAIGDGANDVSMIRAAHVGVGIRGKEGMQAANASDFAVSKFRFLTQLLLVHGTLSYYRNSLLILYFFYKNIMIATQQVYFLFYAGYSSEEVFDGYMLNTFNLCWTALPILLFSVFDRPVNVEELLEFPQLYLTGLRGELFNFKTFWISFGEAILHGSVVFLCVWHTLHDIFDSYWVCSVATYTAVVLVANTKMAMITSSWFWFNVLIILLTVLVYFVFISLYCGEIGFQFSPWLFGVIQQILQQPMFYLVVFFLCIAVFLQDFTWTYIKRIFMPSLMMLVQETRSREYDKSNTKKEALLLALNAQDDEREEWKTQEMGSMRNKEEEHHGHGGQRAGDNKNNEMIEMQEGKGRSIGGATQFHNSSLNASKA